MWCHACMYHIMSVYIIKHEITCSAARHMLCTGYTHERQLDLHVFVIATIAGMLSKSKGQILRVSAVLHVLFHLDTPLNIPDIISEKAVKAADNFVDLCLQHAAFLGGRNKISEAIDDITEGIWNTLI